MKLSLRAILVIGSLGSALAFGQPAYAAGSVVTVILNNKPITTDLPSNLGMAMSGTDPSKGMMSVTAYPDTVQAGDVTFVATNRSPDFTHEMILVRIDNPSRQLPYVVADTRVDEDAAGHLGEVSELDPGKTGSLTMTLEPGTYMLFCNLPGHYMAGMWTTITVK